MPVVLRKEGDRYRFIGECHIHGIMQGQVIGGLEKGGYKLETFILY
jgi:hypothetical protein